MKVCVLGSGSWGTALANHLARAGREVVLWGRDPKVLEEIAHSQKNTHYLKDIPLSTLLRVEHDLQSAVKDRDAIVFSVPSHSTREVAKAIRPSLQGETRIVSTAKGLEEGSHKRLSVVLNEELQREKQIAVLSGPSFALEVARGLPTAVTIAASSEETLRKISELFHFDNLRIYRSQDMLGVELGGAVKNVIALAAGVVDGMELGLNARAAIITRGLAEMKRLVERLGGSAVTVTGLSGLGDLLLTATGDLSRNRSVGVSLGRGESLQDAVAKLGQVAEGVRVAKQVMGLARENQVEMPIVAEVSALIEGSVTPHQAVKNLLTRGLKEE